MGLLVCHNGPSIPKIVIDALSLLVFIRDIIFSLFSFLGFSHFIELEPYFSENQPPEPTVYSILIRELLPVIKFSDLLSAANACEGQPPESCAVCLHEFEGGDDIRCLINCKHIFHRSCLDRWMDHDRETCPLCRKHFVPQHLQEEFNQRFLAASYINNDFCSEDNLISSS